MMALWKLIVGTEEKMRNRIEFKLHNDDCRQYKKRSACGDGDDWFCSVPARGDDERSPERVQEDEFRKSRDHGGQGCQRTKQCN